MANPTLKLKNAQQKLLTIANVNLRFQVYTEFSRQRHRMTTVDKYEELHNMD